MGDVRLFLFLRRLIKFPPEEPLATVEIPFVDTTSSRPLRGRRRSCSGVHAPHPHKAWGTSEGGSPCGRGVYSLENGHDASSLVSLLSASMQHSWGLCVAPTVKPSVEITGSVVGSVACSVFRRRGPFITYVISLMGLCCRHGLHTGRRQWKSRT